MGFHFSATGALSKPRLEKMAFFCYNIGNYPPQIMETRAENQTLDEKWYSEFEKIGSTAAVEYLKTNKAGEEEQKKKFLENEIGNPAFSYPAIKIDDIAAKEKALLELKSKILAEEPNEVIRKAYQWKINAKLAELRMIACAGATANPETTPKEKAGLLHRFSRYSEFIFGAPDKEVFAFSIDSLKKTAEGLESSEDPQIARAANDFMLALPVNKIEYTPPAEPTPELIARVEKETLREVGKMIDLPERSEKFTAEEIKPVIEDILAALEAKGWTAVIENQPIFSISQAKRQVKIPVKANHTRERLQALIAHEIGTHVVRRLNGERSKFKLLGLGLDRYDQGEEGVTTIREQSIQKKFDQNPWLERHLAIGLAAGLDGTPHDFREVFGVMQKYHYMLSLKSGKNPAKAKVEADQKAWDRCVRTFRGTDCKTKGVCFTKDIIYAQGNIAVWDVIGKNPDELMRLSIGKYDPSNPRHLWILNQLGITEKDLEELQK
jgi:hypothetical protein